MTHSLSFPCNSSPFAGQSQASPWRGALVVAGMRASDRNSSQQVYVTAVETDGESRMDLWPYQFFTYVKYSLPVLREFLAWVNQNNPPTCTFLPSPIPDPNSNAVNQTNFRSLSRILFETQTIAIASWNADSIPGAGIIIYPAQNSSAILIGALFLHSPFPDFVLGMPSAVRMSSPTVLQQHRQAHYSQVMSGGARYPTSHPRHSASPDSSNTNSPVDAYHYMVPQTMTSVYHQQNQTSSSIAGAWGSMKGEDGIIHPYGRAQDHPRFS
ncbi:hypothetical protein AX15_000995 [Amanita polypyramis BW_CC]|nr:hypothetical protein AX15_000995 [Amanita polypyramis BW_CC]